MPWKPANLDRRSRHWTAHQSVKRDVDIGSGGESELISLRNAEKYQRKLFKPSTSVCDIGGFALKAIVALVVNFLDLALTTEVTRGWP